MHVIVWEFTVKPEKVQDFVAAYKTDGDWAQLFRQAEGYGGTELLVATDGAERYVTIDRWRRAEDFAAFQERFGDKYRALDQQFEGLTLSEKKLGSFVVAS